MMVFSFVSDHSELRGSDSRDVIKVLIVVLRNLVLPVHEPLILCLYLLIDQHILDTLMLGVIRTTA